MKQIISEVKFDVPVFDLIAFDVSDYSGNIEQEFESNHYSLALFPYIPSPIHIFSPTSFFKTLVELDFLLVNSYRPNNNNNNNSSNSKVFLFRLESWM